MSEEVKIEETHSYETTEGGDAAETGKDGETAGETAAPDGDEAKPDDEGAEGGGE